MSRPRVKSLGVVAGPMRVSDFALFALGTAMLAAMPWTVRNWPTQDGPSHLAVAHVLMHYDDAGAPFSKYLSIDGGTLRPSTLYYGILAELGAHVGLRVAEKVIVCLTIAALPFSVLMYVRRIAPDRAAAAFLVLPLVTGWALAMGFVSFLLALSCAYLVLALAWEPPDAPEQRLAPLRWGLAAGLLVVCAWLHPVVSASTGFALLLLEGPRLRQAGTWRRIAIVGGPAAAYVIVSYLLVPGGAAACLPRETNWQRLIALVPGLIEYQIAYSAWELVPRGIAVVLLFWFGARGLRQTPLAGASAQSAVARVIVAFLALYMLMPKVLGDWYYCSTRFLLFATFLLPAVAAVPERAALLFSRLAPAFGVALSAVVVLCELPALRMLSAQMDDVIAVGSSLPRGSKLVPMDFGDRRWGTVDKPQPLSHAWARLVETRDVMASQLFAAGKPRMGGDRFRMLSFRPGVIDIATGTLPWSSFEGVYEIPRKCNGSELEACQRALAERRESLDAVIDRYDYILMVSPPAFAREALTGQLAVTRQVGASWLFARGAIPLSLVDVGVLVARKQCSACGDAHGSGVR